MAKSGKWHARSWQSGAKGLREAKRQGCGEEIDFSTYSTCSLIQHTVG